MELRSKYDLLQYLATLKYTKGAEIGVAKGEFSEAMFKAIPKLTLFCIDNWEGYRGNAFSYSQEKNDRQYRETKERLSHYPAEILKMKSTDALKFILDESLDFVYIDANHGYDYVMQDLIGWSGKVRKGGMVIGDDYYPMKRGGVVEAVDDYTRYHKIKFNIIDPRPYKIKDRGFYEQPTYWWVK